ncbi:MAG TPA: 30S ribosome-binding factor RbfA [Nitrospiraceae bacterium]|nr:30S ribosome-binding factor RbfA [Nitrospiraceae bacterium]
MHPYKRSARVGDLIREEIADIIMHRLKDPRIGFITVTGADVSDDLRHAKVYVSILEDAKREETLQILISSARFIRGELGRRIKMKILPELIFKLDNSIEYGAKIDRILKEIKERDEGSS